MVTKEKLASNKFSKQKTHDYDKIHYLNVVSNLGMVLKAGIELVSAPLGYMISGQNYFGCSFIVVKSMYNFAHFQS